MRKLIFAIALIAASLPAFASDDYLKPYFKEEAKTIGAGEYYHRGLIHVYDAELYSPDGTYNPDNIFALKLTYTRKIGGADIAEKSIEEMDGQEKLDKATADKWLAEMKAIFPNVKDGTSLTGLNIPDKGVIFFKDGSEVGRIEDKVFARRFFDIWLGEKTSSKSLRKKLLNQ